VGYLLIIRPVNCVIAFLSALVGAWIGRNIVMSPPLILAAMITFIVCAFGNIINDLKDIEIDRINNPTRPLPSCLVDKKIVRLMALVFCVLALVFSLTLDVLPCIFVLATVLLLFLYACYFKKMPWGNVVVALLTGFSFLLGGAVARNPACLFPFLFSLCIHYAREIIKDIIDIQGDRAVGVTSLPIVLGVEQACNLSALALGVLCILMPLPFILKTLGVPYIAIILIIAYPMVIYTILRLLQKPLENELRRLSNLLKVTMAVGLVAMIV
jgi:geranylgeranylglycerol-phosphate geranylgeranyltransferase